MAWTAVFLSVMLMPLLMMIADGGRLLHVRNRLQTATDAACEDAAWSAADFAAYRDSGTTTFEINWYWIGRAQSTFQQTLFDQDSVQYTAWVQIVPDYANAIMNCQAAASVPLMVTADTLASPVTIQTTSHSRIRFRNLP